MNEPTNPDRPHQHTPLHQAGRPLDQARAAMIMIHGRGATAESILSLADMLERPEWAYVAPQAADHTWYPHSFLVPREHNEPGISSALRRIGQVRDDIQAAGIPQERILLLGFSQGACLSAEFAARYPARWAGIAILTGGLIGQSIDPDDYHGTLKDTPVILSSGDPDPHIPWSRVEQTAAVYRQLHAELTVLHYPGRPHTVSHKEIEHVRALMDCVSAT